MYLKKTYWILTKFAFDWHLPRIPTVTSHSDEENSIRMHSRSLLFKFRFLIFFLCNEQFFYISKSFSILAHYKRKILAMYAKKNWNIAIDATLFERVIRTKTIVASKAGISQSLYLWTVCCTYLQITQSY